MGCRETCTSCSRYLLITILMAMAIFSLAVIGLALWIRFDANFERQIRNNLLNMSPNPPDFYTIKEQIRLGITISFWVIIGLASATLAISLIGICGTMTTSRAVNAFTMSVLVIIVLLEIAIGIFVIIYRTNIKSTTDSYSSLAFQYSTSDATALTERYACCGDGTQNPYNQQCLQVNSAFTRDCPTAVWERLNEHLLIAGLVMLGVILGEILAIVFAFVLVLNHRHTALAI